ncbi:MAG: HD domain-containing protein [bacterium]|nr:HD domain-containing protein [bacterium]
MPTPPDLASWERRFEDFLGPRLEGADPAHDLAHVRRVVTTAKRLAATESARLEVVVPAAWLHDCVTVPKDSPRRSSASADAAESAGAFLLDAGYSADCVPDVRHAIEAHSFSAGIAPETVEARVVQDADRLDALGAIGIARCLMVGGALDLALHHPHEPFPVRRQPDDSRFVIDHFYVKLLRLADTMQTSAGRAEGRRRSRSMEDYLRQLGTEIGDHDPRPKAG